MSTTGDGMDEASLRAEFDKFDKDGTGAIDFEEFGLLLRSLGLEMRPQQRRKGFETIDTDGSGQIGFEEFAVWWSKL